MTGRAPDAPTGVQGAARGRPLRVLYVDHCALHSGGELALARLLPALEGVEPLVVLGADGPLVDTLREAGIAVEVLAMAERSRNLSRTAVAPGADAARGALDAVRYALALAGRIRRFGADLVVTNSLKASLYGGLAGRLAGVPVIWHVHDRIAKDYLPAPAVALVRGAARVLPAGIVANSRATLATLSLPATRRVAVPTRVVANATAPVSGPGPVARAGPLRVALVGRLAPWKGQDLFLRAFSAAFAEDDAEALVVGGALFGEDDFAAGLVALAEELGIAGRVRFLGHVEDVAGALGGVHVLVHASTTPEPFGQVVVEGLALGLCVVAADSGGPAEIVTDGVDGLLYRTGDAAALAAALERLRDDEPLRARLAAAGPASAARFAPAVVAHEMSEAYEAVLARRHRPSRAHRGRAATRSIIPRGEP